MHVPSQASLRMPAQTRINIEGIGNLVFYATSGNFVAECKREGHLRCFKTRTAFPSRRHAQGRPPGHLFSWLCEDGCQDQRNHLKFAPNIDARRLARMQLKDMDGAAGLFEHERARVAGEDSEPEGLA